MEPPASRQRQPQLQTDQGLAGPIPELTYTLQEAKDAIDTIVWHDHNVQHSLTADGGYTTSLELESKPPEDLVDALYEDMSGDYSDVITYYRSKKAGKEEIVNAGNQEKPKRAVEIRCCKAQGQCISATALVLNHDEGQDVEAQAHLFSINEWTAQRLEAKAGPGKDDCSEWTLPCTRPTAAGS